MSAVELAYLAGPMTGYPDYNAAGFAAAADWARTQGWEPVSPHDTNPGHPGECPPGARHKGHPNACWYAAGVWVMLGCHRVVLLPGWEQSVGARIELAVARVVGLPVGILPVPVLADVREQGGLDHRCEGLSPFAGDLLGLVPGAVGDADVAQGRLPGGGSRHDVSVPTKTLGSTPCAVPTETSYCRYRNRASTGEMVKMLATADEIRDAALSRYGHEDGAPEEIAAGTPLILIDAVWAAGGHLSVHVGPAIRLTDDTYIRATDAETTAGYTLKGRRASSDTVEAAARRAAAKFLPDTALPVEFTRFRGC